ncbi:SLC13 family permease [Haloarcula sp. CBA1130]|uniref:SLC13 family permease n=1 Tax=unclassified Haloarcula TaxID=2624677 RepID=UPI0012482179|nr:MULTISPECIES: SLC13 family permease [unclassified Haloarcula]KAA9398808.1 SLC13 family permease [Haloarcula sp. CBA1129]KAA9403321.1 SLC13 family permease [Haloarcula sp. CBA1130]
MPPLSTGALVVFALVAAALTLFVTEWLPPDITAVAVLVALVVLEPYTGVPARTAIEGFASPAVVTIVAMYILSAGVESAGVVDWLAGKLAALTGGDERRLLTAIVGTTGVSAGFVNNTPVVAVFIPLVTGLSDRYGISPSNLLLPLSFAAMLGGTLTLVGTSTNLLASDLSAQLLDRSFSMFTLTPVGIVILVVGVAYLLTVGRALVPERIHPAADFTEEFDMDRHLAQLRVREASPLIGLTVQEALEGGVADDVAEAVGAGESLPTDATVEQVLAASDPLDIDVLQIDRNGESFFATATDRPLEPGDVLTVRGNRQAVNQFAQTFDLRNLARESVTADLLAAGDHPGVLAEAVIDGESRLRGRTLADVQLRSRFDVTVLAVRRGDEIIHDNLEAVELSRGDLLLLQTPVDEVGHLQDEGYLVLTEGPPELFDALDGGTTASLDASAAVPLATLLAVIALAALDLLPIYIAALGGVVATVATGTLSASKAYDAVSWNVVFLLAGLLPLGQAMQATGGAAFVGALLVDAAGVLPPLALLALVYLLTAVLASVITPAATVVLMIPIAVATAAEIGVAGFPFLAVVTFAVATAFLTPIGYQTNLMVYGPGGYRFTDFARVGAPLQLLLCVVTTLSVSVVWPL